MPDKKIDFAAAFILPVAVILTTAVLFFIFKPENPTPSFYINLGYLVLLEIFFFGYLNLLRGRSPLVSTPYYTALGLLTLLYIVIGACWMGAYSFFLEQVLPVKYYLLGIIVLTLFGGIIAVIMAQFDNHYKETVDQLDSRRRDLEFYTGKMEQLASRYAAVCGEKGVRYQTGSNNRTVLDRLNGKVKFLTPDLLEDDRLVSQLNVIFDKCEELIASTESSSEKEQDEIQKKMKRWVEESILELDMLRYKNRK